ncbi:hypothetical protein M3Y94_00865400 [Aphelenchoides besseyi]|nr:hypothetical protein M3Y94_00865400 [Aphelenchoides besseyi]
MTFVQKKTTCRMTTVECQFGFKSIGGEIRFVEPLNNNPINTNEVSKNFDLNPDVWRRADSDATATEDLTSVISSATSFTTSTPKSTAKSATTISSVSQVEAFNWVNSPNNYLKKDDELIDESAPSLPHSDDSSDTAERRPKRKHRKHKTHKKVVKQPDDVDWKSEDSRRLFHGKKKKSKPKRKSSKPSVSSKESHLKPKQPNRRRHRSTSCKTAVSNSNTAVSLREVSIKRSSTNSNLGSSNAIRSFSAVFGQLPRKHKKSTLKLQPPLTNAEMIADFDRFSVALKQRKHEARQECLAWIVLGVAIVILMYVRCEILFGQCD